MSGFSVPVPKNMGPGEAEDYLKKVKERKGSFASSLEAEIARKFALKSENLEKLSEDLKKARSQIEVMNERLTTIAGEVSAYADLLISAEDERRAPPLVEDKEPAQALAERDSPQ